MHRRPSYVINTMPDPQRGSQLGKGDVVKMCVEDELYGTITYNIIMTENTGLHKVPLRGTHVLTAM